MPLIKSRSEYALEACMKIADAMKRIPVVYVTGDSELGELIRKGANPCDHVHTAKKKIQVDATTVAWTEDFFCTACGDKVMIR